MCAMPMRRGTSRSALVATQNLCPVASESFAGASGNGGGRAWRRARRTRRLGPELGQGHATECRLPERVPNSARLGERNFLATPAALHPLPMLGIPGVVPENENPAYYDDASQFRPGRRAARHA